MLWIIQHNCVAPQMNDSITVIALSIWGILNRVQSSLSHNNDADPGVCFFLIEKEWNVLLRYEHLPDTYMYAYCLTETS